MSTRFPTDEEQRIRRIATKAPLPFTPTPRIGVISNPRSHRNQKGRQPLDVPEAVVIRQVPDSHQELLQALVHFDDENVDLIVIDGGDGTVRDVLSAAHRIFKGRMPRLAVLRSGKTNALAMDLGIPRNWTLADALKAHLDDHVAQREPMQVRWIHASHPDQLGFVFGFGAYVRASLLAQSVHKYGWFNGVAVFLTIVWALLGTFLGRRTGSWNRGSMARVSRDNVDILSERLFLIVGSTLHKLPLGIRLFGRPRGGLKFLAIKAPPKAAWRFLPAVLRGTNSAKLERNGYIRRDTDKAFLAIRKSFILDGERFPGGNLAIERAAPVEFVIP